MQLRYCVLFRAQECVNTELALKEKLINIEGTAMDPSVNANKWYILDEDLEFIASSLAGAQLRVDHTESALMVVGVSLRLSVTATVSCSALKLARSSRVLFRTSEFIDCVLLP